MEHITLLSARKVMVIMMWVWLFLNSNTSFAEEYIYDDLGRLVKVVSDEFKISGRDNQGKRQVYIATEEKIFEYDLSGNRRKKQTRLTRIKK